MVAGAGYAARGIRRDHLPDLARTAAADRHRGRSGAARRAHPVPARLDRGPLRRSHPGALAPAQPGGPRHRADRRDRDRHDLSRTTAGKARGPRARPRHDHAAARGAAGRRRRDRRPGRSALHLRELRGRPAQRARLRRREAGRRARGAALQSLVPLRRGRPRQDPSDARDRLADPAPEPGPQGRLPVGRKVHVPVHQGVALQGHHELQGAVPLVRRPDGRRRPVHRRQGQHPGGVFPYFQYFGRPRPPDRGLGRPQSRPS